jgi:hypothetical protein
MMDTWWNEAIEQQAIDRVHRLGQNKPVFVTRYIIKGVGLGSSAMYPSNWLVGV